MAQFSLLILMSFNQSFYSPADNASSSNATSVKSNDLSHSWLSVLMRMLSHPVVQRSQQLTDRMLRLLAQISRNVVTTPYGNVKSSDKPSSEAASTTDSATGSSTPNSQQGQDSPQTAEGQQTSTPRYLLVEYISLIQIYQLRFIILFIP